MDLYHLQNLQKDVLLSDYTTFRIGGPAKYFLKVEDKESLIKALSFSKNLSLPFFILGAGSNLLVSDSGYEGLVINFQFSIFNFQDNKIISGSGVRLGRLVQAALENNLSGLEWAAGIPGTLGGAIFGNAAAFDGSTGELVEKVEVLDTNDLQIKSLRQKECQFGYRDSIFKHKKNLIILSALLSLKKSDRKKIEIKMREHLDYKKKTQPLNFSSAGSVFKNPKGYSAGFLIDKCGLKGKRIGNVEISKKHANFIVNLGGGKAKDVMSLIKLAKESVKKKYGIILEPEIQFLGFPS